MSHCICPQRVLSAAIAHLNAYSMALAESSLPDATKLEDVSNTIEELGDISRNLANKMEILK